MAIDTAAKRFSALTFGAFWLCGAIPSGVVDQAARQDVNGLYSGILVSAPVTPPADEAPSPGRGQSAPRRVAQYTGHADTDIRSLVFGSPVFVEIVTPSVAGAELEIVHDLGRIPNGAWVVKGDPGSNSGSGADGAPAGTIIPSGASAAPTGYLACDGSAVSRTTYADLFTAIGTAFGVGNGTTTFNVPDLRGRAPIGSGTGSGLTARTLGASGGAETHQLTEAELASHTHVLHMGPLSNEYTLSEGSGDPLIISPIGTSWVIDDAGSDQAHNNMQPFGVVSFFIKHAAASGGGGGGVDLTPETEGTEN